MEFNKDTALSVLFFNKMLTPKIITFVYWLALIGIVISSVGTMFVNFMAGLVLLVGGVIGARITFELMIVLFKINDNIQKIADKP